MFGFLLLLCVIGALGGLSAMARFLGFVFATAAVGFLAAVAFLFVVFS